MDGVRRFDGRVLERRPRVDRGTVRAEEAQRLLEQAIVMAPDDPPTLCLAAFSHMLNGWCDWSEDVLIDDPFVDSGATTHVLRYT